MNSIIKFSIITVKELLNWILALKPAFLLVTNYKRTDCVFEIYHKTKFPFNYVLNHKMVNHENYTKVKNGEFAYFEDKINNMEYLSNLPQNTLGYHCFKFFEKTKSKNKLLLDIQKDISDKKNDSQKSKYMTIQTVYIHDILHVLTGYGVHSFGESPLQIFSAFQVRLPATVLISGVYTITSTIKHINLAAIKTLIEGFRIGMKAKWIVMEDFGKLLEEDIQEIRNRYNIETPELYFKYKEMYKLEKSNVV